MHTEILSVSQLKFLDKGPYSFRVFSHDCIGLSGQSGIGKTQLFKAIVDLVPFEGEIVCNGFKHTDVSAPRWRSMITLVLAESFWWYDTVGEHFPVGGPARREVMTVLGKLGFEPEVLDWSITQLSSGERQRLSLLRSLLNRPVLLLLDEPTSSLDGHHTIMVEELIRDYCSKNKVPVVWVSHDEIQLERVASRRFVMQEKSLREITE